MRRLGTAALFAIVGISFFVHWTVSDPTHEGSKSQNDWDFVLGFSGVLLLFAIALPVFAQLVGRPTVFQVSLIPAAGATLASLSNIIEDGLRMEWAFGVFILGTLAVDLGLLTLTAVIAFGERGSRRFLALIPAGSMVAVLGYVELGGILMLITWLGAAVVALALPTPTAEETSPQEAHGPSRG